MRPVAHVLAAAAMLPLLSCTALRVATHSTSTDPVAAPAGTYHLDAHHWSILFDVDHLGYSRFVMRFDRAAASLDFQPQAVERSRVTAVIEAASLDTNDPELDRLVAGPDLLDAGAYPQIRFTSTALRRTDATSGEMDGDLTIHGATRPVTLHVVFHGAAPNPLTGEDTLGFSAEGAFHRSEFGLSRWFPAVGDEIRIHIQAEFEKKPADR